MAQSKSIAIHVIAQTRVNWDAVKEWMHCIGATPERTLESLGQPKEKGSIGTDASSLVAMCGKRCYMSFQDDLNPNVKNIREDHKEYILNILKSGHGSVLEHATWTFSIENISRVFTGEMNRHRVGTAISEGSMRYIRYDDIGYWMPDTISENPSQDWLRDELSKLDMTEEELNIAKAKTREVFHKAFEDMESRNQDLCNVWKIESLNNFKVKKLLTSMFRRQIGMGIATGGVWTINARALRHILTMRASSHAEEEIFHVFNKLAEIMISSEPLLFGDFKKTEDGSWKPAYQKV